MQFEFLMMEVMQCGLSWQMMIQRREVFRSCFDNFEYDKIAEYSEADIRRIMETPGMIRSLRTLFGMTTTPRCNSQRSITCPTLLPTRRRACG